MAEPWLLTRVSQLGSLSFREETVAYIRGWQGSHGVHTGGLGLHCPPLYKAEPLKW